VRRGKNLFVPIGALIFIFLFLASFWLRPVRLGSDLLNGEFRSGDWVLLDRRFVGGRGLSVGDIIAFRYFKDSKHFHIGRVVALAGDRIEFRGGELLVNGSSSDAPPVGKGLRLKPRRVPEGRIFIFEGTNGNRFTGGYRMGETGLVVGRVVLLVFPPGRARSFGFKLFR